MTYKDINDTDTLLLPRPPPHLPNLAPPSPLSLPSLPFFPSFPHSLSLTSFLRSFPLFFLLSARTLSQQHPSARLSVRRKGVFSFLFLFLSVWLHLFSFARFYCPTFGQPVCLSACQDTFLPPDLVSPSLSLSLFLFTLTLSLSLYSYSLCLLANSIIQSILYTKQHTHTNKHTHTHTYTHIHTKKKS